MHFLIKFFVLLSFCVTSFAYTILKIFPSADGEQFLLSAIQSAQDTIQITEYGFTYKKIALALIQQQKRGVKVQLLIEHQPYRATAENEHIIQQLQRAHIDIHYASSKFSLTHQKTVLIDHQQAIIMTGNLTYSSFYKQRNFMISTNNNDIVENLTRLFFADWYQKIYQPSSPTSSFITSPENSAKKLISFISGSQHTLNIYALELTDKRIIHALLKKNKVAIRLLIASTQQLAQKKELCQGGIEIHQLGYLTQHAKALLRDYSNKNRLAYIGSANLTYPGLSLNREVGIFFSEKKSMTSLHTQFEKDWKDSRSVCHKPTN